MKTHELLRNIKRALELPPEAVDWSGIVEAIDVELAKPEGELEFLAENINHYFLSGGLFNPELANHDVVRELLIDIREAIYAQRS